VRRQRADISYKRLEYSDARATANAALAMPGGRCPNLRKHGVSFDFARLVFDDPITIDAIDEDEPEDRSRLIGIAAGLVPVVADEQLERMRRVSFAKLVRCKLRMSQTEFAGSFHTPIGSLRDWEQHRCEPGPELVGIVAATHAQGDTIRGSRV
jgi:DNA-binding transcriptional regulator YiaG